MQVRFICTQFLNVHLYHFFPCRYFTRFIYIKLNQRLPKLLLMKPGEPWKNALLCFWNPNLLDLSYVRLYTANSSYLMLILDALAKRSYIERQASSQMSRILLAITLIWSWFLGSGPGQNDHPWYHNNVWLMLFFRLTAIFHWKWKISAT